MFDKITPLAMADYLLRRSTTRGHLAVWQRPILCDETEEGNTIIIMKPVRHIRSLARKAVASSLFAAFCLSLCSVSAVGQEMPHTPPLSEFFRPATGSAIAPDEDGFLRRWLLLEPITKPNRTNTVFTGEYVRRELSRGTFPADFNSLPRPNDIVQAAEPRRWHALDSKLWDVKLFNFAQALDKRKYGVVFWAVTAINSPREIRDVRLAVRSNSASRWWLNGEVAAELFDDRRMVMDDVLSDRLTLRNGRNILRGAVINGPGPSDFCIRFIGQDARPIRDITIDVQ